MERVVNFLKEAETYYLATVEGDQPRVRPFGTAHVFEGKLYIQTGKVKDVSKQIHANPKVEICAFKNGEWLRVAGELVEDDRREARQSMLDAYPSLQNMYSADDGNTEVFYFMNCSPSSRQLKKYKFFLPAEISLLAVFMQLASKFHVFPLVLKFQDSFANVCCCSNLYNLRSFLREYFYQ